MLRGLNAVLVAIVFEARTLLSWQPLAVHIAWPYAAGVDLLLYVDALTIDKFMKTY
jgi:hypothetical protein